MADAATKDRFARAAEQTAAAERAIQDNIDRKDKAKPKQDNEPRAMQAGARRYPEPPLPAQHLKKPGNEADLDLAPMYDAPHYKGSEKLKDKVALITGGDSGIGRAVAVLYRARRRRCRDRLSQRTRGRGRDQARGREGGPPLHHDLRRRRRSATSARTPWTAP